MNRYKRIVYLVDNKRRDLPGAALLANRLLSRGISCELQPLEAYRAVMYAFKPDLVLINHLLATHLVEYSQRLHSMNVPVAVLPNEGINYEYSELMFNAGKAHNGAHIDLFFCWNEIHKKALSAVGFAPDTIHVVGSPRFDFYFEPWSGIYKQDSELKSARKKVLFCTNLTLAKFYDLPRSEADKFFASWSKNAERYKDYWGAIAVTHRNRGRVLAYLDELLSCERYDVTLRIHPTEDPSFYQSWESRLPGSKREGLRIDHTTPIAQLMLACDVEISLDSCTTAIDAWLARKPTIDLELERHELLSNAMLDPLNVRCKSPKDLPLMVEQAILDGKQEVYSSVRKKHLIEWCGDPQGNSADRIAEIIAQALSNRESTPSFWYSPSDIRRGIKLKVLNKLGRPYNWHPQLQVRQRFRGESVYIKKETLSKTITPVDVAQMTKVIDHFSGIE